VRRHDGTVVGGAVTVVDVTELRETAGLARESAEEVSALLDAVPVAVLFARTPNGTRIDGNRVVATLFRTPVNSNFSLGALTQLGKELPDALLVDISMPEMDGYALIQAIRRSGNGCAGNRLHGARPRRGPSARLG